MGPEPGRRKRNPPAQGLQIACENQNPIELNMPSLSPWKRVDWGAAVATPNGWPTEASTSMRAGETSADDCLTIRPEPITQGRNGLGDAGCPCARQQT